MTTLATSNETTHNCSPAIEADAVGQNERRGSVTMSLLWLSMVASFPSVLTGFDWYRQRLSFTQVLLSLLVSFGILLLYSIPICMIAVKTGLSFKFLCRKYFHPGLSKILTLCLVIIYLGWYAIVALLMADACCGIVGGKQYLPALAFGFSFAMAFNNFFGFKGVANFARFIGGPAVICWVIYTFVKCLPGASACVHQSHDVVPLSLAFCTVSQFIVGFTIWGNEADFWRNSNSKPIGTGIALAFALIVGEVIFPLTGYMIATKTGITESAAATAYLNTFTFGSFSLAALLFLGAQYFAGNDGNLYAFAHAVESFTKLAHKKVVVILAFVAGLLAVALTMTRTVSALEAVCAVSSVLLPTATVLIIFEWFLFRKQGADAAQSIPLAHKSVVIAWSTGAIVGIVTSGIIPQIKVLNVGIPALQAWIVAISIYIPLRKIELKTSRRNLQSN